MCIFENHFVSMKVILAIDSFKGCLTSEEVEQAVAQGIQEMFPHGQALCIPIADGGEGTLNVLMKQAGGTWQNVEAHNPRMEKVKTTYGIAPDGKTAFIEMAAISGLTLIKEEQRNPMLTTSYGTGELIAEALDRGCTEFIIGLGGSATNDAGMGMLQALGYQMWDKQGRLIAPGAAGGQLQDIERIDDSLKHPLMGKAHFIGACDVNNPLYGAEGAAYVFARQKGADETMITALDKGLRKVAEVVERQTGIDLQTLPGSGAAGGMGGGLMAFLNAQLQPGAEILLKRVGFEENLSGADLIITGEGKADRQTLMGKIPGHILKQGLRHHIPVILIAGRIEDKELLMEAGFKGLYTITPDSMVLSEAMKPEVAKGNIRQLISQLAATYLESLIG